MIKKIVFSAIAFLVSFIVAVIVFLPLNNIVSTIIDDAANVNKIDLRYDKLEAGFFGAKMTNIQSQDLVINSVTLDYNPLGLILRRIVFNVDSPLFIASGKLSGNDLTANITASVAGIAKMTGFDGAGSVKADIGYNLKTAEGKANVSSGEIVFKHPLMNVTADSLTGEATVKNNIVTISKVESTGKTTLNAKGSININPKKPDHSAIDMTGTAGMMGMNMNFRIQGPLAKARFTMQ